MMSINRVPSTLFMSTSYCDSLPLSFLALVHVLSWPFSLCLALAFDSLHGAGTTGQSRDGAP